MRRPLGCAAGAFTIRLISGRNFLLLSGWQVAPIQSSFFGVPLPHPESAPAAQTNFQIKIVSFPSSFPVGFPKVFPGCPRLPSKAFRQPHGPPRFASTNGGFFQAFPFR